MIRFSPKDGCLDLAQTLDCGQAFRWKTVPRKEGGTAWRGISRGHVLTVWESDGGFCFDCTQEEFDAVWFSYFDFETDYAAARHALSALDPILREAAAYAAGIRILRQDPWEALCSFIVSQNNNIPRIKGILDRLCTLLGQPVSHAEEICYTFPTAARLAACTPEMLQPLRAGFRAKYLIDAARRVASGELDLEAVRRMPLDEARAALQTIFGVGPKVADCALLYGLHRTESFPMDVWMKRAMERLPGLDPAALGESAGIAQQYIFHYARMHPELFGPETAAS